MHPDTITAVRYTSLIAFASGAVVYLLAYLLGANDFLPSVMGFITTYADLPTYASGLIFLTTRVIEWLGLEREEQLPTVISLYIIAGAVIAGLTILDLFAAP